MATKPAAGVIEWRRPTSDELATGTKRRVWLSRCGEYRIEEHKHSAFGRRYIVLASRMLWGAVLVPPWEIVGRHRTRPAAFAAAARLARRRQAMILSPGAA